MAITAETCRPIGTIGWCRPIVLIDQICPFIVIMFLAKHIYAYILQ